MANFVNGGPAFPRAGPHRHSLRWTFEQSQEGGCAMSAENHRHADAPDPGTTQTSMRNAAQMAQELQRQAEAARASLHEAAAKVQDLEQQAASAQRTITLFQEEESAIARALQEAQRASEELMRTAKARAEETIAASKSAGEGIVHTARTTAAETLQRARESAQEQIHAAEHAAAAAKAGAEDIVQAARAAADETLQKARQSAEEQIHAAEHDAAATKAAAEEIVRAARAAADETLQKARESAEEQIHAAEHAAAEHLARLRAESDQLVAESNLKVQEVREAAEQYLSGIAAKLDAFIRDRDNLSRGLEALARNHSESLQIMTRLRSEVQSQILPAVHRLVRTLKGEEAGEADDTFPLPVSSAEPVEAAHTVASSEHAAAPGEGSEVAAEEPTEAPVPAVRYNGEIVVGPIHSFLQATKFMTALSQIRGVASVKLRTYSGAKATIEVVTEGYTLAGINCTAIDGFPVEVIESTDTHLVLRIGSPAARPVPG
jgi:hypothetical protein